MAKKNNVAFKFFTDEQGQTWECLSYEYMRAQVADDRRKFFRTALILDPMGTRWEYLGRGETAINESGVNNLVDYFGYAWLDANQIPSIIKLKQEEGFARLRNLTSTFPRSHATWRNIVEAITVKNAPLWIHASVPGVRGV